MKFFTDNGVIATVKADQVTARCYYNASLEIQKVKREEFRDNTYPLSLSKVIRVDLDARQRERRRPEPNGELDESKSA